MSKNGQNPQNYVKKSISNTEFDLKFDKNHSQLPFSMVFVDLDTYLIDIRNLEISYTILCTVQHTPTVDQTQTQTYTTITQHLHTSLGSLDGLMSLALKKRDRRLREVTAKTPSRDKIFQLTVGVLSAGED